MRQSTRKSWGWFMLGLIALGGAFIFVTMTLDQDTATDLGEGQNRQTEKSQIDDEEVVYLGTTGSAGSVDLNRFLAQDSLDARLNTEVAVSGRVAKLISDSALLISSRESTPEVDDADPDADWMLVLYVREMIGETLVEGKPVVVKGVLKEFAKANIAPDNEYSVGDYPGKYMIVASPAVAE